jgi:hypothetical protein
MSDPRDPSQPAQPAQPARSWDGWLAELEAEFDALRRQEETRETVAAVRHEVGEASLWEQLARRVGVQVTVTFAAGVGSDVLRGELLASYQDFCVIQPEAGSGHHLVRFGPHISLALPALQARPLQPTPSGTARVYSFKLALRLLARQREPVRIRFGNGTAATGTLEAVGADYLELAEHDPSDAPRRQAVRARRVADLGAVAVVSLLLS